MCVCVFSRSVFRFWFFAFTKCKCEDVSWPSAGLQKDSVLSLEIDWIVVSRQVILASTVLFPQLHKRNVLVFSPTDKAQGLFKKLANLGPPRGFHKVENVNILNSSSLL